MATHFQPDYGSKPLAKVKEVLEQSSRQLGVPHPKKKPLKHVCWPLWVTFGETLVLALPHGGIRVTGLLYPNITLPSKAPWRVYNSVAMVVKRVILRLVMEYRSFLVFTTRH